MQSQHAHLNRVLITDRSLSSLLIITWSSSSCAAAQHLLLDETEALQLPHIHSPLLLLGSLTLLCKLIVHHAHLLDHHGAALQYMRREWRIFRRWAGSVDDLMGLLLSSNEASWIHPCLN